MSDEQPAPSRPLSPFERALARFRANAEAYRAEQERMARQDRQEIWKALMHRAGRYDGGLFFPFQ